MQSIRKRRYSAVAALLLLLLLGLAGAMRERSGQSSLSQITALRDQLASAAVPSSLEQRRQQARELRQAIAQLPPAARKDFWTGRRQRFRDWLGDFFRSPHEEQVAVLNSEIDRMNAFRQQGASSPADQSGPGWAIGLSAEQLQERQKDWLDMTSPEERALVAAYFEMLAQQGQQRQQSGSSGFQSPWGSAPT